MNDDAREAAADPPLDLRGRRAIVVVPAYNESAMIGSVLRDLERHAPWADVVVVNDGSTDDTSDVARRLGARVVDLPVNLGIGGAVQTGFQYAWMHGYDVAFQFDGDGQHRARLLARLVRPVLDGQADLAVGSRFLRPRGMTAAGARLAGIRILAAALSVLLRQRVTDPTSGFRAVDRRGLALFAREYPQDYPEPESLVLIHKQRLSWCEVPATIRRRRGGVSSISLLAGIHYITKVLLAVVMDMLKEPISLEREEGR